MALAAEEAVEGLFDRIAEADLFGTLDPMLGAYAAEGTADEGFGDWCTRVGMDGLLSLLDAPAA